MVFRKDVLNQVCKKRKLLKRTESNSFDQKIQVYCVNKRQLFKNIYNRCKHTYIELIKQADLQKFLFHATPIFLRIKISLIWNFYHSQINGITILFLCRQKLCLNEIPPSLSKCSCQQLHVTNICNVRIFKFSHTGEKNLPPLSRISIVDLENIVPCHPYKFQFTLQESSREFHTNSRSFAQIIIGRLI